MSRIGARLRVALLAGAVALAVASCTSDPADGPTSTSASPTATASVIDPLPSSSSAVSSTAMGSPTASVIDPPTPSSAPSDPVTQEAADRAAIEAQWLAFSKVYDRIIRTPEAERAALIETVTVEPLTTKMLDAAKRLQSQGLDYYGSVIQHPYWVDPVGGQPYAVMRDCQDQSQSGSVWVSTGEKNTVGVERNSLQVGFIRGSDGIWRVQTISNLEDVPC